MGEADIVDHEPTITDINNRINNLQARVVTYQSKKTAYPLPGRTTAQQAELTDLNTIINAESKNIGELIQTLLLKQSNTYANMESQAPAAVSKINEMMSQYDLIKTTVYDSQDAMAIANESAQITTATYFFKYVLYLLLLCFVVISLFYIRRNPEGQNLDMFILSLASFILVYYLYEYLSTKAFMARWLTQLRRLGSKV